MDKKHLILLLFTAFTANLLLGQQKNKTGKAQVHELTGAVTLQSIRNANPAFVGDIPPTYFNNINELYSLLQDKGTLILRNAVLNLSGLPNKKITLSFHRIEMINSSIYIQDNDINLICNEYKQSNSYVQSFNDSETTASDGNPGATAGQDGSNGSDGLDSGDVFVFVTDKIVAASGNIDYYLFGQNGGRGGNGNTGANGAAGARGRNCSDGGYQCNRGNGPGHNGQNGQKGGNAGNGGNGGDGGKLTFRLHGSAEPYHQYFTFNGPNGAGGQPGNPAPGGIGGVGGKPGSSRCGSVCAPYTNRHGNNGQNGATGFEGNIGANGTAKVLTRGIFNVDFLKNFLSSWASGVKVSETDDEKSIVTQRSGLTND